jgi:membrane protein HdeD
MSILTQAAIWLPPALGIVMIGAGATNLRGSAAIRASFARWGYPDWFNIPTGALEIASGTLLLVPATSVLGAVAAMPVLAAASATLLRAREWAHLPGALGLLGAAGATLLASQVAA